MQSALVIIAAAAIAAASSPSAAQILVAARPIPRDTVLAASDLTFGFPRIAPADALTEPRAAIGQQTLRAIGKGAAIRAGALAAPTVAERGDRLTLRAEAPGIAVEAAGVARADARVGSLATAVNELSGQTVRGRLSDDGVLVVAP